MHPLLAIDRKRQNQRNNDTEHAGYHENTAVNKLFHKQSLHIQLKIYLY